MKEFFDLIPEGWTVKIEHLEDRKYFRITFYDNAVNPLLKILGYEGAANCVCVTPEFLASAEYAAKILILETVDKINKLYGL